MKNALPLGLAGAMLCALVCPNGSAVRAQTPDTPGCAVPGPIFGQASNMRILRIRAWQLLSLVAQSQPPVFDSPKWVPKADAFTKQSERKPPRKGLTLFFAAEFGAAKLTSLAL